MNKNFLHDKQINDALTYKVTRLGRTLNPLIDQFNKFEFFIAGSNTTINNPSGTPSDFQTMIISVKDTGTSTLTWDNQYKASGTALPTTTTANKFLTVEFVWRAYDRMWHLISSAQEA